jgi:hypothetical protein
VQLNNQYDLIIHNHTFWPNAAIKPTLQGFYLYSKTYLTNLVWSLNVWVYCNMYWGGRREERFNWEKLLQHFSMSCCFMTKLDLSFFSFTSIFAMEGCLWFWRSLPRTPFFSLLLKSCRHQWKPLLWEEEEEEEDIEIIFLVHVAPNPTIWKHPPFFLFGDHVDINGNHYYEKKKKTLKSYFWCMLHPILTIQKHESLLGWWDHQWLNCCYFSRYHGELWMHQTNERSVWKSITKEKFVFDGCLSSCKNGIIEWNPLKDLNTGDVGFRV